MTRTAPPIGAVQHAFHRVVARRARVARVAHVGARFCEFTLSGDDLEGRDWTPGDMIQIAFGGWQSRAYTPITFDPVAGSMRLLGYVHGHGIASAWLASLSTGTEVHLVGPRAALDLDRLPRPLFLFGDETSFATAAALRATPDGLAGVTCAFEVEDACEARTVLDQLGVFPRTLVVRQADDAHAPALERSLTDALTHRTHCVFTGKAAAIQRLHKFARGAGVSGKQLTSLAYWAPGRKGFSGVQR